MTHWHAVQWNKGFAKNVPGFLDGVMIRVHLDAHQTPDGEAKWHAVSLVEWLASHANGVAWPSVSFGGCEAVPIKSVEDA
jgi:hypothetical protein